MVSSDVKESLNVTFQTHGLGLGNEFVSKGGYILFFTVSCVSTTFQLVYLARYLLWTLGSKWSSKGGRW